MVRLMAAGETALIVDYFHGSTPEYLEILGVDPTRVPGREAWLIRMAQELARPVAERASLLLIWLKEDRPIGFSTADRIVFGDRANMHLHVVDPDQRNHGNGTKCVRASVVILFDVLKLNRLYAEPNAFNIAANRTLQKAGFTYQKTHMTVPGPLNFHQAVTQWMIERNGASTRC